MMVSMDPGKLKAIHTSAETVDLEGGEVLRIEKTEKIDVYDTDSYARVEGVEFHNGTIEVMMRSRLLPDAPDFARGFIGIVFRVNPGDSEFESFYVRPTNGRCEDPVRRKHACQYFSYPGYTFDYFREHDISGYEAEADIGIDEWIALKAVIKDARAEFYVNDMTSPVLVVDNMKHGDSRGGVGFFADIGTEAFFKDMKIVCTD